MNRMEARGEITGGRERMPDVMGRVPPRNRHFTGRQTLLDDLHSGLARGGDDRSVAAVVSRGPQALQGMGGVGKTMLAVEYVYRYRSGYDLVWWITADQPGLVRSQLAQLAQHLGLPPMTTTGIDDAARSVLDALRRGQPYNRWLLVFDNAEDLDRIREFIPEEGPGDVIITSRDHRWIDLYETVTVDVFTREESLTFLKQRLRRTHSEAELNQLADALGDLPLALEQAGALQTQTGMTVEQYLLLLKERTRQLLAKGRPTEYPVSMSAAWAITVNQLRKQVPLAIDLLQMCAFFGPEPIPRDVFTRGPEGLRAQIAEFLTDPIEFSTVISELGRYALVRIDLQAETLQVHRLIQALVRDDLDEKAHSVVRHEVHLLLAAAAPAEPDNSANWQTFNELLPHVSPSGCAACENENVRKFARNMARSLFVSGEYDAAETLARGYVEKWSERSGPSHPEALKARRSLGMILRSQGKYTEAREYNHGTMQLLSGTEHPDQVDVLLLRNSIGADYRAQGDFQKALEYDEESLELHKEVFGDDAPETLLMMNNLALDYGLVSRYTESADLHSMTSRKQRADRARNTPHSLLLSLSGLSRAIRLTGRYKQACDLGEAAFAFGTKELSAEHPTSLVAAKDLSIALRRDGRYEEALERAAELHDRYQRKADGGSSPDAMAAMMNLSNILRTLSQFEQATQLAEQAMALYPQIYGDAHPYHQGCASNLALLHRLNGDLETARRLNENALKGLEGFLGRNHHYSLTVATNLATDLFELRDLENARALGESTARRAEELFGPDHPSTLGCQANLSTTMRAMGSAEQAEAERLFRIVMDGYERTIGLEHPDAVAAIAHRHLDADFDPPPI
jgi:tetratricopeptide (TPR) repeat protein